MKYTYLLINFLTILFPIALSFDKRVQFYKSWRYIWPGMALTGLVFFGWDILFTIKGVWSFNPDYIIGLTIFHLPVEEVLFFLTVPLASIFIYECLNYYVKWQFNAWWSKNITNFILIFSSLMVVFHYHHLYTLVTFSLLLILMVLLYLVVNAVWLPQFYRAYIVILIPFYIINGLLTSLPIVIYDNGENLNRRIGSIPVEDHFYLMVLLLMNVFFFEYFRRKNQPAK